MHFSAAQAAAMRCRRATCGMHAETSRHDAATFACFISRIGPSSTFLAITIHTLAPLSRPPAIAMRASFMPPKGTLNELKRLSCWLAEIQTLRWARKCQPARWSRHAARASRPEDKAPPRAMSEEARRFDEQMPLDATMMRARYEGPANASGALYADL